MATAELVVEPNVEIEAPRGLWRVVFGRRTGPGAGTGLGFPANVSLGAGRESWLEVAAEKDDALPFQAVDDHCAVVLDGFLHNRAELLGGPPWPGDANDAAIVLRAYRREGARVLARLRGSFALIVWDRGTDELWAIRDPFGSYPLFYARAGREIVLATSPAALVGHPGVSSAPDRVVLAEHMCARWFSKEETYLRDVRRVPPGHLMRFREGDQELERYWDPAPPGARVEWLREEDMERFDALAFQAVERCLGQGRTGIFLSGGLDSVSVATIAADLCRRRGWTAPIALSVLFPDPAMDEEHIQRTVASRLGLPHVLLPGAAALGSRRWLHAALDLSRSWTVPMLNLWRPAYHVLGALGRARGCETVVTGGGGDEWLGVTPAAGSELIRHGDIVGLWRLIQSMRNSYQLPTHLVARRILWNYGVRPLARGAARSVLEGTAPAVLRALRKRRIARATPVWAAPDPALRRTLDERAEAVAERPRPASLYWADVRDTVDHPLISLQFEESFEGGRRVGLRTLSPYLDVELVEFLCRAPIELVNKGNRAKGLVRDMMARRFPDLGFDRLKKVIAVDYFRALMVAELPEAWAASGRARTLNDLGVVDSRRFGALVRDLLAGTASPREEFFGWSVLTLEAWAESRA